MVKILNLDALAQKEQRALVLGGKEYTVRELSVADFIEANKIAEALDGVESVEVQMDATIKLIQRQVDIPADQLKALNMAQLSAISTFVRGQDVEETPAGEGDEGND